MAASSKGSGRKPLIEPRTFLIKRRQHENGELVYFPPSAKGANNKPPPGHREAE